MSERDRTRWEAKYRDGAGAAPALALASLAWVPPAPPRGLALDVACGRGRHCGPLLARGYRVVAIDIALTALRTAAELAASRKTLMPVQADLDTWPFAPAVFDLVLQCDFLDRRLFPKMKDVVRPGGHVLIDTFCGPPLDGCGPSCGDYRLAPGELAREFASWKILRRGECEDGRDAILAQKPSF
jgi:SAM-dependent methyltransferase